MGSETDDWLTPVRQSRVARARDCLAQARTADLAALDPAGLIMLVESLRSGLDDMLRLVDELHGRR